MGHTCSRCGFVEVDEALPEFDPETPVVVDEHNTAHAIINGVSLCGQRRPLFRMIPTVPWELTKDKQFRAWPAWPCQTCVGRFREGVGGSEGEAIHPAGTPPTPGKP